MRAKVSIRMRKISREKRNKVRSSEESRRKRIPLKKKEESNDFH